jgi:hypothetical protein
MSLEDLRRYHKGIGAYRPDLTRYRVLIMLEIVKREPRGQSSYVIPTGIA